MYIFLDTRKPSQILTQQKVFREVEVRCLFGMTPEDIERKDQNPTTVFTHDSSILDTCTLIWNEHSPFHGNFLEMRVFFPMVGYVTFPAT